MIKTSDIQSEILDLTKELTLIDNVNTPFSSLLLNRGTEKATSQIVNWKYENLDTSKGTALEGADITAFQASKRTTDKNIMQIIEKAVSLSGTATAVSVELIENLFSHELNNRILEAKRDLEDSLINGVYTEENGTTPRQMRGLVDFGKGSAIKGGDALTLTMLQNAVKNMRKAGTASNDLVLLADYSTFDVIQSMFDDQKRYTNVQNIFGSVVQKINLSYGSAYVYVVDAMPLNTCAFVNLDFLKIAELRPLAYKDLAVTGDSKKGFIVMENTLKVLNPNAIQTIVPSK